MKRLRTGPTILAAIIATWLLSTVTAAQSGIPDGVFVRESNGVVWLILNGQRVAVPFWIVDGGDAAIQAIPKADRWAVMNDAGAIVPGDIPAWAFIDQPAPTATPTPAPPDREILTNVAGQSAVSTYAGSQPLRATVREMTVTHSLPAFAQGSSRYPELRAVGKFVVVLVDVENIGTKPESIVLGHKLQDSRGRAFSGETNRADNKVKQAVATIYRIEVRSDEFQPNLPVPRVFVYDVPEDAHDFVITGTR